MIQPLSDNGALKSPQEDTMSRNQIQFQKGISLPEFIKQFGTPEQCHDALIQWRWPKGFKCPECETCRFNDEIQ